MVRKTVKLIIIPVIEPETIQPFKQILDFKRPNELSKVLVRSDQELGGFSTAHLDIVENKVAHFHGNLNLDPPPNRPDVMFSGYAMFRTKDQENDLFGRPKFWDWEPYHHVELRVKGDTRKYFVNIQADTGLLTDIYQHRLFLNNPGNWETVVIPIDDFILTNWGNIQEQSAIERERIKTIGIGLLDKQFGPFNLYIDYIKVLTRDGVSTRVKSEIAAKEREESDAPDFGNARI
ncbi:Complex I intermediate-associated protein 30,mitochondrial [Wickerhamomyces ciferrii]|uniref:Complex I intermediate-associated protein 30,mitochondrial n=1 Tax=Wickerhamomyces ciferrii (strain ATCC 14091 / BCRC 22168 / CBS 111 / JCM 3599 / NBRC 0793 / NRRL Y-1031 F-60-10) TaxID=1206466 RepID=K0KL46_WICCF|nr:Complex I intermediate-associated protein 30,mitochondrial [Wickerhamomyces ciferrii]CCH43716.1 Complex I intermediate-associated protein 30,mitochondrial [Wickerhamomyces ciferrii]